MNEDIKSTVEQCPKLRLQVNKGEIHRITHEDVKRGSLWIGLRLNSYSVETGEYHYGKHWNLSNYGDVAKVIRQFNDS